MKLKSLPEDFVVIEIDPAPVAPIGSHGIYTLKKRGIGTLEAVGLIAREWEVARADIGVGGLKDKWAMTEQTVSIYDGPPRSLTTERFELVYRGRRDEAVRKGGFEGNRFRLTLRDLSEGDATHLRSGLTETLKVGIPNYFDSQRFGSSRGTDDFIARRLLRGDIDGALKLAIATPTAEDRGGFRRLKKAIRDHWGRWSEAVKAVPRRAIEHRILRHLELKPTDPGRAFELIEERLRRLYMSAYQSYLWNETLKRLLRGTGVETIERRYAVGSLLFHRTASGDLAEVRIPFLRKNVELTEPVVRDAALAVLAEEQFTVDQLRPKGLKNTFFSGGERAAIVFPRNSGEPRVEPDELNKGRLKAEIGFDLPSGAYATLVVKRLFH